MAYMMEHYGFVMLIRHSPKFRGYLKKILAYCNPEETCLVYSQFRGYILPRHPAYNAKLAGFVRQFSKVGCFVKDDLHTSGHASMQDLARLCEQVNPRIIIPIHKDKKADFKSILPDGKGACILPHGVLFRGSVEKGDAEAKLRKALVESHIIKGIIGLPANLFYGTGIPACIIIIDKAAAKDSKGIFMIDAKDGFYKDVGAKIYQTIATNKELLDK